MQKGSLRLLTYFDILIEALLDQIYLSYYNQWVFPDEIPLLEHEIKNSLEICILTPLLYNMVLNLNIFSDTES